MVYRFQSLAVRTTHPVRTEWNFGFEVHCRPPKRSGAQVPAREQEHPQGSRDNHRLRHRELLAFVLAFPHAGACAVCGPDAAPLQRAGARLARSARGSPCLQHPRPARSRCNGSCRPWCEAQRGRKLGRRLRGLYITIVLKHHEVARVRDSRKRFFAHFETLLLELLLSTV